MSPSLPNRLYTAAQSRAVDAFAIAHCDLPGPLLMARAARAAFDVLLSREPQPALLQILCGPGNNGGDGLLLAVLSAGRGIETRVFLVDGEPRSPDAVAAAGKARAAGIALRPFDTAALEARGVVVDGMLGTGIAGAPRPAYEAAIRGVKELGVPILALDVPSGLDADTGAIPGLAVHATWTVSFITAKRGSYTAQGPDVCGELFLCDLEVPEAAFACDAPVCDVLDAESLGALLPARSSTSHKGSFGRCLLIGGEEGMGGAVILAAEAALRTGLGLLAVATRERHIAPLLARRPECMAHAVGHRNELEPLLQWADSVIVGPGLGRAPWGQQMLHAAVAADKPLLLDADALNLLAASSAHRLPAGCVLTPHPGEAARLLACTVAEVQADRFSAASRLAQSFGATIVLKGRGSIVATGDQLALCGDGNAGMASGGTGDVLSGVIGGLMAQGLVARDAAALGTVLHGRAGDRAARALGQRAMLATDLVPHIGELLR